MRGRPRAPYRSGCEDLFQLGPGRVVRHEAAGGQHPVVQPPVPPLDRAGHREVIRDWATLERPAPPARTVPRCPHTRSVGAPSQTTDTPRPPRQSAAQGPVGLQRIPGYRHAGAIMLRHQRGDHQKFFGLLRDCQLGQDDAGLRQGGGDEMDALRCAERNVPRTALPSTASMMEPRAGISAVRSARVKKGRMSWSKAMGTCINLGLSIIGLRPSEQTHKPKGALYPPTLHMPVPALSILDKID